MTRTGHGYSHRRRILLSRRHSFLDHSIPLPARRASSHPLRTLVSSRLAKPDCLCLYRRHNYCFYLYKFIQKKILFHLLRDNISSDGRSRQLSIRLNYSALLQSTQVLSHCAHFVESQHSFSQEASHGFSALSQPAQSAHSVAAHSPAFSELLLHAHEAAANIAATTANDINTFFMVTKLIVLNKTLPDKGTIEFSKLQIYPTQMPTCQAQTPPYPKFFHL